MITIKLGIFPFGLMISRSSAITKLIKNLLNTLFQLQQSNCPKENTRSKSVHLMPQQNIMKW